MTQLIDKKSVLEAVTFLPAELDAETVQRCIEILSNQPTVDAVPVRHGRWEYGENESGYDGYYCSKCFGHVRWYGKAGEQSVNFIKKYNYCPYCGARMKGADDE